MHVQLDWHSKADETRWWNLLAKVESITLTRNYNYDRGTWFYFGILTSLQTQNVWKQFILRGSYVESSSSKQKKENPFCKQKNACIRTVERLLRINNHRTQPKKKQNPLERFA